MIKILVKSPHTLVSRRALVETVLASKDRVQRKEVSYPYQSPLNPGLPSSLDKLSHQSFQGKASSKKGSEISRVSMKVEF